MTKRWNKKIIHGEGRRQKNNVCVNDAMKIKVSQMKVLKKYFFSNLKRKKNDYDY